MIKAIGWVMANIPLLFSLATAAVTAVEAVTEYIHASSAEKKAKALQIIRDQLDNYVTIPGFLQGSFEAVLGAVIDGVVFFMNATQGKDWKASENMPAVVPPPATSPGAVAKVVMPQVDEKHMLEARADFERVAATSKAKVNVVKEP